MADRPPRQAVLQRKYWAPGVSRESIVAAQSEDAAKPSRGSRKKAKKAPLPAPVGGGLQPQPAVPADADLGDLAADPLEKTERVPGQKRSYAEALSNSADEGDPGPPADLPPVQDPPPEAAEPEAAPAGSAIPGPPNEQPQQKPQASSSAARRAQENPLWTTLPEPQLPTPINPGLLPKHSRTTTINWAGLDLLSWCGLDMPGGKEPTKDEKKCPFTKYFLLMVPKSMILGPLQLTNEKIKNTAAPLTLREFVQLLASFLAKTDMRSVSVKDSVKAKPRHPAEGRLRHFGIGQRFRDLAHQFTVGEPAAEGLWPTMDGFIADLNAQRRAHVIPGGQLVVDEGMIKWRGQTAAQRSGGIVDRRKLPLKPESIGAEVKMVCDGPSGILLGLVRATNQNIYKKDPLFTQLGSFSNLYLLVTLCQPWLKHAHLVCADAAFASFRTAKWLLDRGVGFVGPVKRGTANFPAGELKEGKLEPGQTKVMVTRLPALDDGVNTVAAVRWRGHRDTTWIATYGDPTNSSEVKSEVLDDKGKPLEDRQFQTIPAPGLVGLHRSQAHRVDTHNQGRQGTLGLERGIRSMNTTVRGYFSILGMCIMDAYYAYRLEHPVEADGLTFRQFYRGLAVELSDNYWTQDRVLRSGAAVNPEKVEEPPIPPMLRMNHGMVLRETFLPALPEGVANHSRHSLCRVCKKQSIWCCATCSEPGHPYTICNHAAKKNFDCFMKHLEL